MRMKLALATESLLFSVVFIFTGPLSAQQNFVPDTVAAGIYDMGKMWTFDYPPKDYFSQTYHFNPDDEWFRGVRMSALRFGNGCSASFVSDDGLVMTNHHCARGSALAVQKTGENIMENGFYATKFTDERKVGNLYVDQLVKIEDITERMEDASLSDTSAAGKLMAQNKEFDAIKTEYSAKPEWKGLELQLVTLYNGGKYSLYGFKRYRDVRLVFIPEMQIAFFGGDYDNFTYPRYNLDCSFFRVYGDDGTPLKTPDHFKFSQQGVTEGEPVFVVGNPGTTLRLYTMADLEFRRNYYLPLQVSLLHNVSLILQQYNAKARKDSIMNIIFGLENSYKALNGELDGLNDPYLIARKASFEKKFRTDAAARTDLANYTGAWGEIVGENKKLTALFNDLALLGPSSFFGGQYLSFATSLVQYASLVKTDPQRAARLRGRFMAFTDPSAMEIEENLLAYYLTVLQQRLGSNDEYVTAALNGHNPADVASYLLRNTKLTDPAYRGQLLADTAMVSSSQDPLMQLARLQTPRYLKASSMSQLINAKLSDSRSKLGRMLFELYGTKIPPDATFSLRINDGIVEGYSYNGTLAPPKTTFYGMYDRYYSFDGKFPWTLPARWKNPPEKLLNVGFNFSTTNDIIGGNSGSAMINQNREVIGLVFDGNIESLPGRFIYVDQKNRAVGVNSAAIIGALKYVYKAKRLTNELTGSK